MAVYIDKLRLMDALSGEELTHVDLGPAFRARFKNPYAVVHRGDLHHVLLKACRHYDNCELKVSSEVVSYDQDGSSVTVRLSSGETASGSVLIGADGLWSNVRKQVVGDGPPRVSGHTTYRSVIPTEQMPERFPMECGNLMGWSEVPHRTLPAFRVESVQPCRKLARTMLPRRSLANRSSTRRSEEGSNTSTSELKRSFGTDRTGDCGCSATEIQSKTGLTEG
jgi:2-polyprenyl-6-methoxyphenol hydroxylase-like FAD-dependent oxidoreductase